MSGVEPAAMPIGRPIPPDHLTPIVLVALNTGLRKGEIFNLRWSDVDLVGAQLTVQGDGAKSGQTRHVPLNAEALDVLHAWRSDLASADGYVFPGTGPTAATAGSMM